MKQNLKIEEDEIQVLGSVYDEQPKDWRKWIYIIIAGIILLMLLMYFLSRPKEDNRETIKCIQPPEQEWLSAPPIDAGLSVRRDSINNVPFDIYTLHNLSAELQIGLPDIRDTSIVLVVQAADVRKDNREILGDFVMNGIQITKGKSKKGYCAIVGHGNISLGVSTGNQEMDYCIANKGFFFRQFPLVWEGEIYPNTLKGKAHRRAIANRGDQIYIVSTCNRESLYDFSEALADMGMTNAIYLIGGTSYGWYRQAGMAHEFGEKVENPVANVNYLVFRR